MLCDHPGTMMAEQLQCSVVRRQGAMYDVSQEMERMLVPVGCHQHKGGTYVRESCPYAEKQSGDSSFEVFKEWPAASEELRAIQLHRRI